MVLNIDSTLPPEGSEEETQASIEAWLQSFHQWVQGHPKQTALPVSATSRVSFYEEDALSKSFETAT
jgi:hypothetical protein